MRPPFPGPITPPPKGCVAPLDNFTFCDKSLSPERRAELATAMLTLEELAAFMNDAVPAVPRLGMPQYAGSGSASREWGSAF